jgi:beta-glucanase (GH16 family)
MRSSEIRRRRASRISTVDDMLARHALVTLAVLAGCVDDAFDEPEGVGTAATALTARTATFRTQLTGHYLVAEGGGGGAVNANRTAALAWETFTILDRNDGALVSGDLVFVRAHTGHLIQAAHGGGGAVNAGSFNQLDHETFRIVKRNGGGTINHGDLVGLQTLVSGRWLSALGGGGGGVDAHGVALDTWESFHIGFGTPSPTWNLVWSDEFNGPSIDGNKWVFEVKGPGWVNNERQNYTNHRHENARIENGALVIEARRDWFAGHEYSSARLKTQGRASWRYGKVEARIQLPGGRGTWPAFWMMPDDMHRGWPACGEIDIMEEVGYDPDRIHATTHAAAYNWQSAQQRTASTIVGGVTTGFHVYTLEWSPSRIDMFVDGVHYYSSTDPGWGDDGWPFNKPFHIILNLAVGGSWGGAQGIDPNIWPRRMLVDWVRVYQR